MTRNGGCATTESRKRNETKEAAFEAAVTAASLARRREVRVSAPGAGLATGPLDKRQVKTAGLGAGVVKLCVQQPSSAILADGLAPWACCAAVGSPCCCL
jgi:hypothetical protein